MPATVLSHQALVLPLKMRWPRHFSGLGLCIGSMAPDLEFIARMTDDWVVSHTWHAQVWFTIPVTLLLVAVCTRLLVPNLLPYLRDVPGLRLCDLQAITTPSDARSWGGVAVSAFVGGMSHVTLDGVTHGNHSGWLVPMLPWLRTPVPQFGGPVPLYDALQCWLTVLLALATLVMWRRIARERLLWRWASRAPESPRTMPRQAGVRLASLSAAAAVQGGVVGLAHSAGGVHGLAAAVAFGAIDFAFLALVAAATLLRWLPIRDVSTGRAESVALTAGSTSALLA